MYARLPSFSSRHYHSWLGKRKATLTDVPFRLLMRAPDVTRRVKDQSSFQIRPTTSSMVDPCNGWRRRPIVCGATKKHVQDKLKKLEHVTVPLEPERLIFEAYFHSWLKSINVAPATRLRYEQLGRLHSAPR